MNSSIVQRLTLLLFLIIAIWFGFYILQPPTPQPASADATSFSAERAFDHARAMAKEPRPLGSAANDSARNYIVNELTEMGLEPEIQKGVGMSSNFGSELAGYTKNIFARIDGQDPEKTILLMSHYDSVPNAPGAGDDAAGVAAIIESARAILAQDTPLKNNVWLLFTDGEERGLLGANQFMDDFTELNQIDLVMNFEGRGSSGASMMFETSSPNSGLIPHFAEATPNPVANSLMYTVYKLLPNDTDLSVTKEAGLRGLNFAFAKDYLNYHTMQDTPENLSLASLQHHGSNLLGNVRHFGNLTNDLESDTEYVYFNNASGGLLYYPSGWSPSLAVVTALLFIAYLIYLFRTKQLSLGSYLGSLLLFIGITAIGASITYFGWQGIKLLHPQYRWLIQGETYANSLYLWGFLFLIICLFSAVYGNSWIRKNLSVQKLLAGSYTIWILLSLGTAWFLPTTSYIFTCPVLMGLAGWVILDQNITEPSWRSAAILGISLFSVLFLVPPYIHLIQVMMTTEMLAVSMVLLILILGLIWPLFRKIIEPNQMAANSILTLAGLACFLMASVNSGFDAQHKKQNDMNYLQNIDTNQAYWFSRDHTTDRWTEQFLGSDFEKGPPADFINFGSDLLYSEAKLQDIAAPIFQIAADSISDSHRFITLLVDPQKDGIGMGINWERDKISGITIDGKQIFGTDNPRSLDTINYFKDLSSITEIHLTIKQSAQSPGLSFTFMSQDLPTHLISNYIERNDDMMPKPHWFSNASLWQASVNLDTLAKDSE